MGTAEIYKIDAIPVKNTYIFTSKGPRGDITKVVHLAKMAIPNRFELRLADWINNEMNFDNISNNRDLTKLFNSIGAIVHHFIRQNPKAQIFIKGNNTVKTRLYQMKISENLSKIEREFNVVGSKSATGDFTEFRKGENYYAFLVYRR